jgi:predicted AAA+ superfamily ATPase
MIFLELMRREKQTAYFKTPSGEEVDFVIKNAKKNNTTHTSKHKPRKPRNKRKRNKNPDKSIKRTQMQQPTNNNT